MDKVNIREYLYHGICGTNAVFGGDIFILESMLKTGYIVNNVECRKYGVIPSCNIYASMGYSPRISLGFYPMDQEVYSLSKKLHLDFYGERIVDKIISEHDVQYNDLDEFIMNSHNLNKGSSVDYAWPIYYRRGITLLLSKNLLSDLKISNYGMLADEICIDESIDLRKYLRYVALDNEELLDMIIDLLDKYDYDVPIIKFPSGSLIHKPDIDIKRIVLKNKVPVK